MPVLKMTLNMELDGVPVSGFPKIRRLSVDESQQFRYEEADDGDTTTFSALPTDQLAEIQALCVEADQVLTYRFDGQSDAGVTVNAGGLLLFFNVDIDAGASTNATVNNNSGSAANVKGIGGGT